MARYGMLIDTTRCVTCYACRVSCQTQNSLPPEESFIHFLQKEQGAYPKVMRETFPIQCQHCENAPCEKVCPTGATYTRKNGIVLVDPNKCIGCKYCMVACPYGARVQSKEHHIVEKCRFCVEEVEAGRQPACVRTCIADARIFGDLDNPDSEISQEIILRKAVPLRPDLGTKPKIFYVR